MCFVRGVLARCSEQDWLLQSIEEHQAANQTYLEEGFGFWNSHSGHTDCSKSRSLVKNGDS
jgi:hypothetical protein